MCLSFPHTLAFYDTLVAQTAKCLSTMRETRVWSLGREDLLEKEMATYSSILAWKIPWTEELLRLQSIRLQRLGHKWATSLFPFTILCKLSLWLLTWLPNGLPQFPNLGFPCGSAGKESACNAGDLGSIPGLGQIQTQVGKIPWRSERLCTPVFWPGEFHGVYSP